MEPGKSAPMPKRSESGGRKEKTRRRTAVKLLLFFIFYVTVGFATQMIKN